MKPQRGSSPKDLFPINEVILEDLELAPKRWRELWNNIKLQEMVRSKEILSRALKELESFGFIQQSEESYKVRPYQITEKGRTFLNTRRHLDSYVLTHFDLNRLQIAKEEEAVDFLNEVFTTFISMIAEVVELDDNSRKLLEPWVNGEIMRILTELTSNLKHSNPKILKKFKFPD